MISKKLPGPDKTILTTSEACGYINLCWNSLKKLIKEGDIQVVRIGRKYLIPKESIDNYLNHKALISRVIIGEITRRDTRRR